MGRKGQEAVRRLFSALDEIGLVKRENYFSYHCPHCQTVLVSKDVQRRPPTTERYKIFFPIGDGRSIRTNTFLPELLLGAVAVAVNPHDEYSGLAGGSCLNPLDGRQLPVIRVDSLEKSGATFLVPAHSRVDAQIAEDKGITECPRVYDELGRICASGYAGRSPDDVRQVVLTRLGTHVERVTEGWRHGADGWNVERCSKCKSIVVEGFSQEVFVDLSSAIDPLQRYIASGEVTFAKPHWQGRALKSLNLMKSWCISRQNWWGNPLPTAPESEVLSPWFSLTALMLLGTGWPDVAEPEPIHEMYINPPLLERLVLPCQLISIVITGRPLFRQTHIYGVLHVEEIEREEQADVPADAPDEERIMPRKVRRQMRGDTGNIVQPKTLISRFGADALRLGYMLCLDQGTQEKLLISEAHLRRARKAVQMLTAKVTGLYQMRASPDQDRRRRLLDSWLLARCEVAFESAKSSYEGHRLREVAELLLDVVVDFRRYVDIVVLRSRDSNNFSMHTEVTRAATAHAAELMWRAFGPVCPYLFEKLAVWTRERSPAVPDPPVAEAWLHKLDSAFSASGELVELASPDPAFIDRVSQDIDEIERLARTNIKPTASPSVGTVTDLGQCLLVQPGKQVLPQGDSELLLWYRSILAKPS
jgi:valyl-tRNA synthetase